MIQFEETLGNYYSVNGWRKVVLSIQHFVAMFGATILVPLLTGLDPLVALFTAGFGTLIFHQVTKKIVPVFLGSSFAFISPILLVKEQTGNLQYATGGIVAAGVVYLLFSLLVKIIGIQRIKKLFPPVVTGPMIIVIGLSLSPVAINMASKNWGIAIIVIISIILASTVFKGFFTLIPILIGVTVGYIASILTGTVNFEPIYHSSLISLPNFLFPKFNLSSIIIIAPVAIATFMEHIGDITTNGAVVNKNFIENPGLHRTLVGDGLATIIAGFLGGPANTTYSENTGVLALTRIYDPSILRLAAIFAILMSFFSKFGSVLQTIPKPVIGGVSLILFGMIASVGIRTIVNEKVNFSKAKNLIVASLILTIGIGGANIKIGTVEFKGLALAAIVGVISNLLIPDKN
ncbi:uracil-xanthine permease family protein [Thermosipho atlanticus]|uniref:Uracil permease n=1 Tax=Thermosipho atlanticus DSM 15807 TaxID=1123380 RepID=A0A1M5S4G2_9BACT|nr:solute carrier family 23 protein [Thermosipho atlanticus]SHH33381.1 uracil permease [Thermosipho atlanticus DSM 15807]